MRIDSQRFQISNKVLLLVTDICLIVLSLTLATVLLEFPGWLAVNRMLQRGVFSKFLFVLVVFTLGLLYSRFYSFVLTTRRWELLVRCFRGIGVACLMLALIYARYPDFSLGPRKTAVAIALILVSILGWRLALSRTRAIKNRMERILVLGTGAVGRDVATAVSSADDLDMEIVGFLEDATANSRDSFNGSPIIGRTPEVETVVERERVDRVVLSLAERRGSMPLNQLLRLKFAGVEVEDAHTMYERLTGRIRLEHLSPSWLFMSSGFRNGGVWLTIKYVLDWVVSVVLLAVFAPIMLIVGIAIWIESGSPIFFVQERVGRHGKHFRMFKFRSMYNREENAEARWATDEDHRITKVGRFIRKFRLDELPQLFNVLKGEMSLVGPRPEQPYFCQVLGREVPYFIERHSVRPGITGWAQVKYQYGATVDQSKTKLEYDLFYLKHMSPLLDIVILFYTINVLLFGKGAK